MPGKKPPKDYVDVAAIPDRMTLRPIGCIHSPYKERFGTPRQPSATEGSSPVRGHIELFTDFVPASALQDLDGFDYIWVISWMHLNQGWNPTVTPPRGPRIRRGLLSTRAPHRPNPIALSAVRLLGVEGHRVEIADFDLIDGTPVLDIKPYVAYADAFPDASAGWVDEIDRVTPAAARDVEVEK